MRFGRCGHREGYENVASGGCCVGCVVGERLEIWVVLSPRRWDVCFLGGGSMGTTTNICDWKWRRYGVLYILLKFHFISCEDEMIVSSDESSGEEGPLKVLPYDWVLEIWHSCRPTREESKHKITAYSLEIWDYVVWSFISRNFRLVIAANKPSCGRVVNSDTP